MGVWTFLALPVYARALILLHIGRLTQTAVALNREDRHVTSSVICYQDELAGSIHLHIAWVGAQRCLLIQESQVAGHLIDSKGADSSALLTRKVSHFIDGI